ncbi:MAG TPA: L-threonylcarbamoyladenylate synthase [archaeon]|nr:L-threonylcarbamoyladenylate synthase [archaeon]
MTVIIKINPARPEPAKIAAAARIIKSGGTVVFPTETVYGLGADATNSRAVRKIYKAKGRPSDNPMIIHIARIEDIFNLSVDVPQKAIALAKKFWPGPLTIVLKKSSIISKEATAGLDTVGIRMPSHVIASALIKAAGVPIAAPSANISGRPSPTKAEHAIEDLNGKVDMIIDGGPVSVGIESTVIDLSGPPALLRPGKITLEEMERLIGKIKVHASIMSPRIRTIAKSPGMKYRHYSPRAKVILITGEDAPRRTLELSKQYGKSGKKIFTINENNKEKLAKTVFGKFREADINNADMIIIKGVDESGIGLAVMNRLKKAATKIIKT